MRENDQSRSYVAPCTVVAMDPVHVGLIKQYPDGAISVNAVTLGDEHQLQRKEHDAVLDAYRRHVNNTG